MKKYCLNCMREVTSGTFCADCVNLNIRETAPHQLKPGTILKEKYLVGTAIGEGGFGITYIGRDLVLDKKVAIKEFYPLGHINRNSETSSHLTIAMEEQRDMVRKGIDRFLDEARNIAQFSEEPGIVDVKDFFEENDTAYIIMEYLEGRTLASHIKEFGAMSAEKVFELMIPIMGALAKIHKLGVIHRDISPDNIMYLNTGVLKLMDFGAARHYMERDRELTSTIKRGYAPVEQYTRNSEQGPWTDVYGLCATMYKCITGVTPADALERMSHDDIRRPSTFGVRITKSLEDALMYGLALHAENRCRSMEELLNLVQNGMREMQEAEADEDYTVYADRTVYTEQGRTTGPGGYTEQGGYTGSGSYTEQRGYTGPGGYTEQRGYTGPGGYTGQDWYTDQRFASNIPEDDGRNQKNNNTGRKKFLIPAIAGGLAILAAAFFLIWGIAFHDDDEKIETIGDYYVTGCKEVMKVRETEDKDSKVVAKLDNGEKVALMEKSEGNYWKVYIEAEEIIGYIDYHYLTNKEDAVTDPVTRYVQVEEGNRLSILNTPDADGAAIGMAERGDEVTVLAKPNDTYAYIYNSEKRAYGYVERSKLSEEEPEEKAKEEETEAKQEDTQPAQAQTQPAGDILGAGSPPSTYQGIYYVNVASGYLALRNAKAYDASNEIGKMYNGDYVQAIRTNEQYWYVYSPSLGAYGYTNSSYLTSSATSSPQVSSGSNVYYASVSSGYLALRNAMAYDVTNEIGKIANGQEVDVVDSSTGTYWYVYVPALNQYGYVNSNYLRR